MKKILILGGTREAAQMAIELTKQGHEVITSLAGRTKEPKPLAGKTRVGGFGGVAGLVDYILENGVTNLVDATHPFAQQISQNANAAAEETGVEFDRYTRPPWKKQRMDNWIEVESLEKAAGVLPAESRILLALGSQHLSPFQETENVFFLVRMVDPPNQPLPLSSYELIFGRPSRLWREEMKLLKKWEITHVVCRNSGGEGAYAKVRAARELAIPVIMIQRPGE